MPMPRLIALFALALLALAACEEPATPTPVPTVPRFWSDNICPQDVTAPPITCTFLRTEGSTIRMPLTGPDGDTYGMILIDAGHVTVVQAPAPTASPSPSPSPVPACPAVIDLNNDPAPVLDCLPGIGEVLAQRIIDGRGTAGYSTLNDLDRVPGIGPGIIAAIRSCSCTTPAQ